MEVSQRSNRSAQTYEAPESSRHAFDLLVEHALTFPDDESVKDGGTTYGSITDATYAFFDFEMLDKVQDQTFKDFTN